MICALFDTKIVGGGVEPYGANRSLPEPCGPEHEASPVEFGLIIFHPLFSCDLHVIVVVGSRTFSPPVSDHCWFTTGASLPMLSPLIPSGGDVGSQISRSLWLLRLPTSRKPVSDDSIVRSFAIHVDG